VVTNGNMFSIWNRSGMRPSANAPAASATVAVASGEVKKETARTYQGRLSGG